ncbi:unnamed protein product (macronuclear) [Paramecium tetraurelia]|uniref:HIT domain-containing protein n=1 Tax=Paramecium tetraurelia TaxID=5888 RepID=A0C7N0_PARTE|nr:uncharacterized protein GSPATT00035927001 [Paramecium tetraurelia]CAK66797.1 unnamed protein product [Paramecium tetraurelia]|eukprot:XP_001434194.1 hypothetical protein (macronuclear) [Paramecium tetraurelia strain d4-2]
MDAEVTIFDKIVQGQIIANIIYEDNLCLAFHDVIPQSPVHILLIPKQRNGLTQLSKAQEHNKEVLGHLLFTVSKIVELVNEFNRGFRVVINDGENGGQGVWHLHLHIIGGEQLTWPPGSIGSSKK